MKKKLYEREFDILDLTDKGIENLIFDLITGIEFMLETIQHGDLILGGDIIYNQNGEYDLSCDNWYSQSKTPEITFHDAMKYLKKYAESHPLLNWKIAISTSVY